MKGIIVYTTGLNDNPETLIARTQHAIVGDLPLTSLALAGMYDDVFTRTDVHGDRSPYPFHEVVTDLVALGFDMRDWTGANVQSILPFDPDTKQLVKLTFASRVSPGNATVKVAGPTAKAFVADMEQSGLWLMTGCEVVR